MTSALPTAETWHPHYDDPDGGLVLVSKEGVKFGTSAKLLAKQGADLSHLEARPPLAETPKTIHLPHPAATIVRFLDIASVSSPTMSTTYDESVKLLELVDHIQAHKLVPRVKAHLFKVMSREGRAADLLLLGSAKNDWVMGRLAIQFLTAAQAQAIQHRKEEFQGFFERLRPEWRRTLIDLIFFASYQETSTSTSHRKTPTPKVHFWDWASVYDKFVEPAKPQEKRKADEEEEDPQKRVKSE